MFNTANILLTHHCNLYCKHCYMNANNKNPEDAKEIFNKTIKTINKLKKIGINKVLLSGGECTTFPYLKEVINYCQKENIEVTIFTNAISIPKDIIKLVNNYCISIEGLKEYHNYIRGNNSFEQTITTLKELKNKKISIQMTISNKNIAMIKDTVSLLREYNIKELHLMCMLNEGRSKINNIDNQIDINKLNKIIKEVYEDTGYNIYIHTNIFNKYDINNYLLTNSILFPLWIDMIDNKIYIVNESNSYPLNKLNKENIKKLHNNINKRIKRNKEYLKNKEYVIIEEEFINNI